MIRKGRSRGRTIPLLIASFYVGGVAGWWLHASLSAPRTSATVTLPIRERVEPTNGHSDSTSTDEQLRSAPAIAAAPVEHEAREPVLRSDSIADLRRRHLRLPIDDADTGKWQSGFAERRAGGRNHEAVDILAPRNTPIHAVESGTIAKLFLSKAGGTTVYQFDPSKQFCYYYAHLERYVAGLHEGQTISGGEVLGYVGTSGNAPPGTPHLHFAIFELTPQQRWWDGRAIDPYLVFRQ